MKKLTTILTLLAASASLTLAQDASPAPNGTPGEAPHHHGGGGPGGPGGPGGGPRMSPEERFKKLDTNNDGSISLEEFLASPMAQRNPEKAKERFAALDTDHNGSLSLEEFKAMRGPGGGHGPKGPHGGAEASPAPSAQ